MVSRRQDSDRCSLPDCDEDIGRQIFGGEGDEPEVREVPTPKFFDSGPWDKRYDGDPVVEAFRKFEGYLPSNPGGPTIGGRYWTNDSQGITRLSRKIKLECQFDRRGYGGSTGAETLERRTCANCNNEYDNGYRSCIAYEESFSSGEPAIATEEWTIWGFKDACPNCGSSEWSSRERIKCKAFGDEEEASTDPGES